LQRERAALSESSTFQCGICYNKYGQDMFGAETVKDGKICRLCLNKKQQELR